jgi:hypothetical protein
MNKTVYSIHKMYSHVLTQYNYSKQQQYIQKLNQSVKKKLSKNSVLKYQFKLLQMNSKLI